MRALALGRRRRTLRGGKARRQRRKGAGTQAGTGKDRQILRSSQRSPLLPTQLGRKPPTENPHHLRPAVRIAQSVAGAACTWKFSTLMRRSTGDSYIKPGTSRARLRHNLLAKRTQLGRFSNPRRPCSSHFDLRLRFFIFLAEALRATAAVFSTAKSSSFAPALSFSRNQRG